MDFFIGVAPSNRGCVNGNTRTYDRQDLRPLNFRLKVLNQLFICMGVSHRHANSIIRNAWELQTRNGRLHNAVSVNVTSGYRYGLLIALASYRTKKYAP